MTSPSFLEVIEEVKNGNSKRETFKRQFLSDAEKAVDKLLGDYYVHRFEWCITYFEPVFFLQTGDRNGYKGHIHVIIDGMSFLYSNYQNPFTGNCSPGLRVFDPKRKLCTAMVIDSIEYLAYVLDDAYHFSLRLTSNGLEVDKAEPE